MYTPGKEYNLYELIQNADKGDLDSMDALVSILLVEGHTDEDPDGEIAERLLCYLRKLAEAGKTDSFIMLGDVYKKGDIAPKDVNEAIRWYEKAVESGNPFGNECIGMMYYEGVDIPTDYRKAYEYFTKDDCKKSFCTIYALGEMFRRGLYVHQNEEKACEYYESIVYDEGPYAEFDDYYWRACYRLAVAYHYGNGTNKDIDEALVLIGAAKEIYEDLSDGAVARDITHEEISREWLLLNRDAGAL